MVIHEQQKPLYIALLKFILNCADNEHVGNNNSHTLQIIDTKFG